MLNRASESEDERLQALHAFDILDTEPDEAFEGIMRLAKSALQVPIALISLVDRDRQWFKWRVGLECPETPRDVSFCAYAIAFDEPMIVQDALSDPRFADNALVTVKPYIRFYLGAQMRTRDGFNLGTVCCIDTVPRTPSQEQIAILRDLARLAVDELELRKLAATDGLTGAMTRRAFVEAGRRDLALARRHRRPFACVLVDVDHFKRVNDAHGHAAGDQVLQRLVSLFREQLRASDYIGRLGGEEFALVLREIDRDGAFEIAERMRRRLAGEVFPTLEGSLNVTVSGGVADDDGACGFDQLLERADAALYQAKDAGRNRTLLYRTPARPDAYASTTRPQGLALIVSHPLNVACWRLQGDRKEACRVISHYNGVLQITTDPAPEGAREGRVTLQGDLIGRIEGDALWVSERQFALAIAATPARRAHLAQIFAKLSREPAPLLTTAA